MIAINPARILVSVLFAGSPSSPCTSQGLDPQSISVSEIGVDGQGHTTWAVFPADPSAEDGLLSPATLVEGSADASITFSFDSLVAGESCTFSGEIALCTIVAQGMTVPVTETISSFAVQGGPAAAATPSGGAAPTSAAPSSSPTPASNPGSGSSSPTATNGSPSASASGSAGNANAGVKDAIVSAFLGTAVVAASVVLAL